jgi:hypothetical protein
MRTRVLKKGTAVRSEGTRVLKKGTAVHSEGTRVLKKGTAVRSEGTRVLKKRTAVHSGGTRVLKKGTAVRSEQGPVRFFVFEVGFLLLFWFGAKLRDKKALNGIVRHEKMLVSINASSPLNEKKPSFS